MRDRTGKDWEGWAFTFCKAAFLVLLFTGKYALLALSGLSAICYIVAAAKGVREWRCWAKPPWVTLFWCLVFAVELARHTGHLPTLSAKLLHLR